MNLKLSHAYRKEEIFSNQLTQNLQRAKISTQNGQEERIKAEHNINQGKKRKPDITLKTKTEIDLEYRTLSNPFYIECKLGNDYRKGETKSYSSLLQIRDNLNQFLKYKYLRNSKKQLDMQKYGDRHVAITTPKLLKEKQDVEDFQEPYINLAQLIRTLWKLGIGLMYKDQEDQIRADFNQQEVIFFDK